MGVASIWHGSLEEALALQTAIGHHCTCELSPKGVRTGKCPAHRALLDQRFLDGLLFARHIVAQLALEEFDELWMSRRRRR